MRTNRQQATPQVSRSGSPPLSSAPSAAIAPQPTPLDALELFVARHATQGFSREALAEIQQMPGGHRAWIDNQLGLVGSVDDSVLDGMLADPFYADLFKSPNELYLKYSVLGNNALNALVVILQRATVLRSIRSKRQLNERMVEFWTDHFNVWINKDSALKLFKTVEDDQVIRPLALGKFKDLLRASAQSAAMLHYLNTDLNVAGAPNENYAREVMELHTLGVDVLYTEQDIGEAAKLLTGWNFISDVADVNLGAFQFIAADHSTQNPIAVLGVDYTAGDVTDGEAFLDFLAARPETAEFVCGKMIRWLLGHALPAQLHARVVGEFISNGGDIALTVRMILSGPMIHAAINAGQGGFKRPSRIVFGLMRQMSADLGPIGEGAEGGALALAGMGQMPFDMPTPDGHSITEESWGSDVYGRWNFANALLHGGLAAFNATIDDSLIDAVFGAAVSAAELRDNIESFLIGGPMASVDRAELLEHVNDLFGNLPSATLPQQRLLVRDAIILGASLPSYQFD